MGGSSHGRTEPVDERMHGRRCERPGRRQRLQKRSDGRDARRFGNVVAGNTKRGERNQIGASSGMPDVLEGLLIELARQIHQAPHDLQRVGPRRLPGLPFGRADQHGRVTGQRRMLQAMCLHELSKELMRADDHVVAPSDQRTSQGHVGLNVPSGTHGNQDYSHRYDSGSACRLPDMGLPGGPPSANLGSLIVRGTRTRPLNMGPFRPVRPAPVHAAHHQFR